MDLNLKGKRALVTGGSKGIGRACAEVLAAEGCTVLIAARNPGSAANAKAIDLSQRGAAETLAEWAGDLDLLVNNAGAIPGGDLLKVEEETWRRAWDLKVFGYINLTRLVYARMKARGKGVIVNIIGGAGEKMNAAYIAGSTGNAGLMAFTRARGRNQSGAREDRSARHALPADGRDAARRRESLRGAIQGNVVRSPRNARGNRLDGRVPRIRAVGLHLGLHRHDRRRSGEPVGLIAQSALLTW